MMSYGKYVYIMYKVTLYTLDIEIGLACDKQYFGAYTSLFAAQQFIVNHNHDTNCFFIIYTTILNPAHSSQCVYGLTIATFDWHGELICDCDTYKENVHKKQLEGLQSTQFKGRDNVTIKRDDIIYYFDDFSHEINRGMVVETPLTTDEVKQRIEKIGENDLEWFDDSYLIIPEGDIDTENHQHILSCFVFTKDFIDKLVNIT